LVPTAEDPYTGPIGFKCSVQPNGDSVGYAILSFSKPSAGKLDSIASFLVGSDNGGNQFSSELHEKFGGSDVTVTLTEAPDAVAIAYDQPDCPDNNSDGASGLQSAFQGFWVGWEARDLDC